MFDAETARLISGAPQIEGLDLEALPQQLTEAYATIVATRLRLAEQTLAAETPQTVVDLRQQMRRLAFTNEAFVSAVSERENRASAAFVAGAAHHVSMLADKLLSPVQHGTQLAYDAISPEISATLLFLIAEASADAAEMAKSISIQTEEIVERALLQALSHLAHGRLIQLLRVSLPSREEFLNGAPTQQAVRTLYYMLLRGVRALAIALLGRDPRPDQADQDAQEIFDRVKSLCIDTFPDATGSNVNSIYAGPLHLASLLSAAARDLLEAGLVNVPPPSDVPPARWLGTLKDIARRRPYLWRNHRTAIAANYLEPGISSVISFPTGAGKSTLAALKIATALLRGKKVIFLAPTLALVDQTARELDLVFRQADVQSERTDEFVIDGEHEELPEISVMTPERCLSILSFDQSVFADVGLLVFDECHLLHPRGGDRSRRSIDAMLCVLNFNRVAPAADFVLLSAMMNNAAELAGWIESLTGRQCLALDLTWKPTRQVRGCVVYGQAEIAALNLRLQTVRAEVLNKDAPAALRREMKAQPFGFFCLRQTWLTNHRSDYSLLPLLTTPVSLATGTRANRSWYLTPNGNQVAAALAAAAAKQSLKTLVFTQTVPFANSTASSISDQIGRPNCTLTEAEAALYDVAEDEMGGAERLFIQFDEEGLISSSLCHHGLLLSWERNLHESLFRRTDGINALVATSTLAQGMNLPSEVVIIGGDSRFNSDANRMEKLEAHELLNAAGRAGRAGEGSHGFVLVVPSKVVNFDVETNIISNHWADLQVIFSQSDQCLKIDDPFEYLLDNIHAASSPEDGLQTYFLRRLPVADAGEDQAPDESATILLNRSFAAYRARVRGDQAWIVTRIQAALTARRADPQASETLTWADRLAAAAGVPVAVIRELGEELSETFDRHASLQERLAWFKDWLRAKPHLIPMLIRRESLEGLLGRPYSDLDNDNDRGTFALPILYRLLDSWMAGENLTDLERTFGTRESKLGKCQNAREFVLRIVPELAYLFGLPGQVVRELFRNRGDDTEPPVALELMGSAVRNGVDLIEKLALRDIRPKPMARRALHRDFSRVQIHMNAAEPSDNFNQIVSRVQRAVLLSALTL